MNKKRKIFIWTTGIDNFLNEKGTVGGITVQMYFWAQAFIENGWKVYSFSENKKITIEKIRFLKFSTVPFISIFIEIIYSLFYIASFRPDVILFRGASRGLGYLRIYSRVFNVKLVFFGASDVNFQPGKEGVKALHDKKLFRFGLRGVRYVVVQNILQSEMLRLNYLNTNCIVIPNIWNPSLRENDNVDSASILWVGNFRTLKRPEWFLELAEKFPDQSFVMVGGALDKKLYEKCKNRAKEIPNISFLGGLPFKEVNELFRICKIFVCTSQIEGFPNAFLQAWANSKPVITTFDPSGIVKKEGLGLVVHDTAELENAVKAINNEVSYRQMQNNISRYFRESHNVQKAFSKLKNFMDI